MHLPIYCSLHIARYYLRTLYILCATIYIPTEIDVHPSKSINKSSVWLDDLEVSTSKQTKKIQRKCKKASVKRAYSNGDPNVQCAGMS